jgi:hypothetical protein
MGNHVITLDPNIITNAATTLQRPQEKRAPHTHGLKKSNQEEPIGADFECATKILARSARIAYIKISGSKANLKKSPNQEFQKAFGKSVKKKQSKMIKPCS